MSWRKLPLSEIADFSNGVNFDKSAYSPGVKLISVSNFGNRFSPDYEELQEVDEKVVRPGDYLQNGDIVFVRSNGNKELVGRCMLIKAPQYSVTYSGFCIRARIKDANKFDPTFFTYYFKSKSFRKALSGNAIGANIQNLSQGRLSNHIADVPDIETQRRIAVVLSAYDDLIENNQKQIKLLEEAAQRLYKEWFVDLRFPGHENTLVTDGIPEGWYYRRVNEFGSVITGKTPSTSKTEYYDGEVPFVTIPDMHQGIYPLKTERTLSTDGANSQKNKYLPANAVMVSCIATVGLVSISTQPCQTNQQINAVVLHNESDMYFFYESMKRIRALLDNVGSNGATMTNVNKAKFCSIEVLYPTDDLVNAYHKFCSPIFEKILSLTKTIVNAQASRDYLLPKLMNGEIEV